MAVEETTEPAWSVYMIEASDGSLYTGISTDVQRRFDQHCSGKGARYFHRGRQPRALVYIEVAQDRASASRREAALKKLPRHDKQSLVAAFKSSSS